LTYQPVVLCLLLSGFISLFAHAQAPDAPGTGQIAKAVGTIKTVQADSITVAPPSGAEITAKLTSSTKILRVLPGAKDLKSATVLQAQELQPGDGVRVRGQASADGHTITALELIVVKHTDVAAKQQKDRDDWQKRGVGGLVTKIDAASGIVTISSGGVGTTRNISVRITKNTILRRYAPGSVNFDDAKPVPLDQVKIGDQLRARGTRTSDGSEISADEIVTGSFRNIAGTVREVDAGGGTITVQDSISKSPVVVKLTSDSQLKKLPVEMAQRIAMRFKGSSGNADKSNGATPSTSEDPQAARAPGGAPGGNGNGPPDLQRMLSRLPNSTLADLHKGDAVMMVATEGADSSTVTAITLLAGVDAILTAAPSKGASTLLSPWSLGSSAGEGEAAQ
jgi:hypothetical protein